MARFVYNTVVIGPGATTATLIAEGNVTMPVGNAGTTPEVQLFTGLTLPPGTYYLIVYTSDSSYNETWLNGNPGQAVLAPGVTLNGTPSVAHSADIAYPPASTFDTLYGGIAFDVTGLPLASAAAVGLIIPQIVDGGGWQTTIGVTNTNTLPANAALQFFQVTDSAGDTAPWALPTMESISTSDIQLAPGATVYLHTPDRTAALIQGFGELVADSGVQAYAIFTLYVPGRQNQDGTALAAAPGSQILVPFDNSPGFTTSIALVNASEVPETLSANLLLASGDTVSGTLPSIPPQGHAAFALSTQFPESAGQTGTLQLFSQLPADSSAKDRAHVAIQLLPRFSVIGLRFNPTGAFTSLPVYVVNAGPF